jgi:single-stranded DNA-binding protein
VYRSTPFGREICDMMLAVNRAFGKSDYVPCIAWGRNAQYASRFRIGDRVRLTGRLQSREYQKLLENGEYMIRMAYEVSAFTLEPEDAAEGGIGKFADYGAAFGAAHPEYDEQEMEAREERTAEKQSSEAK